VTRRILYTRHDGGVSVCTPGRSCLRWMATGGRWADKPRGFVDIQIERQIAAGHHPDAASRFARALAFGGLTEREALEVIRDRDCGHLGTAHDLIDPADLPGRWFRNAWVRSHNGGPVAISVAKAKPIQWGRIRAAYHAENKRRAEALEELPEVKIDFWSVRAAIKRASDETELFRVWPEPLARRGDHEHP
jgi:hypothetical protein